MEHMTMVSGFAQPFVSALLGNVVEEARVVLRFRSNFLRLCRELESLRSLLDDALRWQNAPNSVKNWLERLEEILDDAQETVNDCNREISFHNFIQRYSLGRRIRSITKRIKSMRNESSLLSFMYQMSKAGDAVNQGIPESDQPSMRRISESSSATNGASNHVQRFVPIDRAIGMEMNMTVLMEQILTDNGEAAGNVIGVLGMAGVGKTLLLQSVRCRKEVQDKFGKDSIIWLTVSQNPAIEKLQALLCRQIHLHLDEGWGEEEARSTIYTFLRGINKFLIILDDVWEGGERILQRIAGIGFDQGLPTGSKIVVSTREEGVLKKMGANPKLRVAALSDDQSWQLFCLHAFRGGAPRDEEIDRIAKGVSSECKGLPLAIKTIAAAMAGETDPRQWQLALNQLKNADETFYTTRLHTEIELFQRLRLSYDTLPPCLRLCFLYCAAFPEDEEIDVEYLVQLWIAEGLVKCSRNSSDVDDIGRHYLNTLIDNCLIEVCKRDWEGRAMRCKMHDVLRDMAIRIAEQEERCLFRSGKNLDGLSLQPCQRNMRRISVVCNSISCLPENFSCPKLGTLLLRENRLLREVPEGFLRSLTSLRILDLSWTDLQSLPESTGCMKNLVSLRLSRTNIRKLPSSLKDLIKLQMLDLSGCWKLKCLPSVLGELKSLRYLDLRWCCSLEFLPPSLSGLTSLWSLKLYGCSHLTWGQNVSISLIDLGNLKQLRHFDLDVKNADQVGIPEGFMGNFVEMRSLWLNAKRLDALPEDMKHMVDLEIFRIKTWKLQQLPSWLSGFHRLRWLELSYCQNLKELVPAVEVLPQLRRLHINFCTELKQLRLQFGRAGAFPKLEELQLVGLDKLWALPALEMGAMPRLQELRIMRCSNIKRLPQGIDTLSNLSVLDLSHSYELIQSVVLRSSNTRDHDAASHSEGSMIDRLLRRVHIYTDSHVPFCNIN